MFAGENRRRGAGEFFSKGKATLGPRQAPGFAVSVADGLLQQLDDRTALLPPCSRTRAGPRPRGGKTTGQASRNPFATRRGGDADAQARGRRKREMRASMTRPMAQVWPRLARPRLLAQLMVRNHQQQRNSRGR